MTDKGYRVRGGGGDRAYAVKRRKKSSVEFGCFIFFIRDVQAVPRTHRSYSDFEPTCVRFLELQASNDCSRAGRKVPYSAPRGPAKVASRSRLYAG